MQCGKRIVFKHFLAFRRLSGRSGIQAACLLALLLVVCLPTLPVYGEGVIDRSPVVLGVEDSWPPFALDDGTGISVEIVAAAFGAMGRRVEFRVLPYARVLRGIESGELHGGFNVTRQQSTEERFVFGESPILVVHGSFYFSPRNEAAIRDAGDIPNGSRVGLIVDYEYGDQYEAHRGRFREYRLSSQAQIVKMLLARRLDVAIMFDDVANYTMSEMGVANEAVRKGARNHTSRIFVAFNKSRVESIELASELDNGLEKIRLAGLYDQIIRGDVPNEFGEKP